MRKLSSTVSCTPLWLLNPVTVLPMISWTSLEQGQWTYIVGDFYCLVITVYRPNSFHQFSETNTHCSMLSDLVVASFGSEIVDFLLMDASQLAKM